MFRFTISDVAVFFGKSPVTLRSWERKGLVVFPRVGGKRLLSTTDTYEVARTMYLLGRVTDERWRLITEALAGLSIIELENV